MTPEDLLDDVLNGRDSPELDAYIRECIQRAVVTGLTLDKVFGFTRDPRTTRLKHCRDSNIRLGAALCDSVAGYLDAYSIWRANPSSLDDDDPLMFLCAELAFIESKGFPLPSERTCYRIAAAKTRPSNVVPMPEPTTKLERKGKESSCQPVPRKSRP